jgi:hypothetical protein
MISQKVIESIKPTLKKMVDDSLLAHIEKIQSAHHVLTYKEKKLTNKTQLFRHYKTSWPKSRTGMKNRINTVDEQVCDSTMSEFLLTVMVH